MQFFPIKNLLEVEGPGWLIFADLLGLVVVVVVVLLIKLCLKKKKQKLKNIYRVAQFKLSFFYIKVWGSL